MVFKIAAIFLVILCIIATFLGMFVLEKKATLEIIAIISIAVLGLRLLSYVVAPKSDSGINEITENKTRKDIKGSEK